jgi:YhcH/YjgK/YiaL family protein
MVHDTLANLKRYSAIIPSIATVVEYLESLDFSKLPNEKVYLDGENLFVIPSKSMGKKREEALLEAHNVYADIQMCISGSESFGWKNREECKQPQSEFDKEKDIVFFDDMPTSYVSVKECEFVLFLPTDAHAPLISDNEIVKLIFKLRVG